MAVFSLFAALVLSLPSVLPQSQEQGEKQEAPPPKLHFESGKVVVGDHLATIDLPEGDRYLQKKEARFIVEKVWGNPPNPDLLGLILPKGEDLFAEDSWVIVVGFEADGYISDEEAEEMDYDAILAQAQEEEVEINKKRKEMGYPTVHLVGWAEKPHYDAKTKKFYWAKNLAFGDKSVNTLNYNIRCLGRRGVLVLNAVSTMDRLEDVSRGAKAILSRVEFTKGNRYSDYVSGDKVAAYGFGALIAGKLALKAGLFKLLLKPLIVVGAILIGFFARLFGKKKVAPSADAE